jgi:hypothetical protein
MFLPSLFRCVTDCYLKRQFMSLKIISRFLNLYSLSNREIPLNISHNSAINEVVTIAATSKHNERHYSSVCYHGPQGEELFIFSFEITKTSTNLLCGSVKSSHSYELHVTERSKDALCTK